MMSTDELALHSDRMERAFEVALRSNCTKSQVGALLYSRDGRLMSYAYNKPPLRAPHSNRSFCEKQCARSAAKCDGIKYGLDCPTVHAEAALLVDSYALPLDILYVTHPPCEDCAKLIVRSTVYKVVIGLPLQDRHKRAFKYLRDSGLEVILLAAA